MLINLVGNALKFTEKGSVTVAVDVSERDETSLLMHFSVTDTGVGISEDKQRRIFEDFYRATNVQHGGAEGTGLGLALVRRHCLNMGGSVEMESTLAKGSTFRMVFPVTTGAETDNDSE